MKETILKIEHMNISFSQYGKGLRQVELPVIRDLDVEVKAGEMVAVVGSSGSGKSLLAHGVMGILPYNAQMGGTMWYRGESLTKERIRKLRGKEILMVPQSLSYLDPLMKTGEQIRNGKKDEKSKKKISTAMIEEPHLVIADEPTPGLDLAMAKRAMSHFRELADMGAGVLVITHDLELALEVADRIVVFYAGTTVEEANVSDFQQESTLRHPYTKALWRALPQNGFQFIEGSQPYVKDMPEGCPFAPRCERCTEACKGEIPYRSVRGGKVRCVKGEEGGDKQ